MRDQNLQTQVDHQVSYSAYPVMVDASSSTTNLFDQTHCTVALQTDTDLLTDASINIDPHGPYAAYVLPGQRLVSAVLGGDAEIAEEQISEVQSRVNKLVEMGHQIVTTCPEDGHLIREIRDTISSVNQLTKLLIAQAVDLLSDSQDLSKAEQLKETGREWADSVQALAAAVEKGSQPWGKPPSRLAAEAAKGGSQLEYEIKHVNHQTEQLVDVAMTTVQAIEADKKQHGADTTNHIQIVRVTASEIAKLAPVLIKTAREASSNRSSMESLNLISQEWATNAKLLVHSVDAITDPPTSTVDYLAISAKSGDPQLFADQVNNIQTLTATLQEIAHNATMGCSDPELIKIVTVTGHKIEKLSAQLVECAKEMTKASDATEHDTASEQFTLVKHKWNSNLQLLTTHVDDLISRMAAPLSKLVGIAVAISKTESETTKQHLMNQFAAISDHLSQHVGVLETTFDQTVLSVHKDSTVNSAGASIKILRKLTPHSIAAARSLTDDQSLAVVEHFQHLRRQWAAKAQSLYTQLISITSVDMTPVLAAFEDMIGVSLTNGTTSSPMPRAQSSADMYNASPAPRTRPYSQADTSEVVKRKSHSSTERPITIAVPQEATPSFNSITAAALNLHQEADQFMSEGNPIISTAKEMSDHMRHLAEYSKGRGIIETKEQMIDAAKEIASSARVIVDYAKKIAQQCTDSRMKYTLEQSAELIPTLGTQLTIIATVKASSAPSDISADVMLVKNAQNLMEAVIKTMREAEAACMKGLKPSDDPEDLEAVALALSWKKNLYHRRNMESVRAPVGKKGLRRIDKSASTSSMVDIIERARTSIGSPPKC
ncbi:vinculin-like [Dysidea avara]